MLFSITFSVTQKAEEKGSSRDLCGWNFKGVWLCLRFPPRQDTRFFFLIYTLLLYFPQKRKETRKNRIKFATSASRNYPGKIHDQVRIQDCGCWVLIGDGKIRLWSRSYPSPSIHLYVGMRAKSGVLEILMSKRRCHSLVDTIFHQHVPPVSSVFMVQLAAVAALTVATFLLRIWRGLCYRPLSTPDSSAFFPRAHGQLLCIIDFATWWVSGRRLLLKLYLKCLELLRMTITWTCIHPPHIWMTGWRDVGVCYVEGEGEVVRKKLET